MSKCNFCNLDFVPYTTGYTHFCSRKCYDKHYYMINKEKRTAYFKELHKKKYVPREKPPKKTEEEKRARRKAYYESHKEYYAQKSHEYYLTHKDDPVYKKRKSKAL